MNKGYIKNVQPSSTKITQPQLKYPMQKTNNMHPPYRYKAFLTLTMVWIWPNLTKSDQIILSTISISNDAKDGITKPLAPILFARHRDTLLGHRQLQSIIL